jgi:hypothetical protein
MVDTEREADQDVVSLIGVGGGERRTTPYIGTKALMLAILEDGIRAYLSEGYAVRQEAELWIHGRRQGWAFSFSVICETLGLEPSSVRIALSQMRARRAVPEPGRRSRPNVRRYAGLRPRGAHPA